MLSADELYQRAVDHANAGRHAVARRTLAEATDRGPGADLAARIEGTLAYIEAETGHPDAALARCAAAADRGDITEHTRAVLVSQLGLIEWRRGDLAAAIPHFTAAIDRLADDPARLGRVALNRGLAHLELGDLAAGEHDSALAADAFDRVGDRVERAKAQHNQGCAALIRGDLVGALRLMDGAREVLATLSPVTLAICDLDRAEVLRAAGMTTDAAALLSSAAREFGARRLRQMQADAEYTLAGTLLANDPEGAMSVARRAARRYRARGNETAALKADACRVTATVLAGGSGARLRTETTSVADRLDDRHLAAEAGALRLQSARLAVRDGDAARARDILDAHAPTPTATIDTRLLAHEVGVELAVDAAERDTVLRHARAGLDDLGQWQATFGSIDLQSATSARGRRLALAGLAAAMDSGDAATALEWSELTRSLAGRIVPVRPPADPIAASELAELRNLRMSGADPARQEELVRSIRRRRWSAAGSGSVAAVVTLAQVSAELSVSEATLVAYLWSGDRLAALTVSSTDAAIIDLGEWAPVARLISGLLADLDMAAAELPAALAKVVARALADRLDRLDEVLVAPIAGRLGEGRIVISAPGILGGVPWGALTRLAAHPITLPTTVSRWVAQQESPRRSSAAGFTVGPGVERGLAEVTAAAAAWGSRDILSGDSATAGGVAALAERVDVLHIAAHGRHTADNPLFSGVELADGPWFGYDIDEVTAIPDVVVLSACEVGRSATGWGRESLGMAQSWLHAGARCVIASPASVGDGFATALLTRTHAALATGVAPADALAHAAGTLDSPSTFQVYGAGW